MKDTELTRRDDVRELVKAKYGEAALRVLSGQGAACCGGGAADEDVCCGETKTEGECCTNAEDPITSNLYSQTEAAEIPEAAILASLGCGNPTALAELALGETVLDLGSGGGVDVLLSARRVGPTGFAYGLDMTDAMLELAERNKAEAGAENVKFLKGHIEEIPLPDASVDVVISNCVINLAADKPAVFREIARVLRPGGRMGVSDVVAEDRLSMADRLERGSYTGCIAGALSFGEFHAGLAAVGLTDISITPTHAVADGMTSAIIQARKPETMGAAAGTAIALAPLQMLDAPATDQACCGDGCCS